LITACQPVRLLNMMGSLLPQEHWLRHAACAYVAGAMAFGAIAPEIDAARIAAAGQRLGPSRRDLSTHLNSEGAV
jgi:hypothetical protein